jgi:pSer/pThr/pTyr-binding forkhead associated (FHA) protein
LLFVLLGVWLRGLVRGLWVGVGAAAGDGGGRRPRDNAPTLPPGPSTLLVQGHSDAKPRTVKLSASMTVGRAPECELRLDDTYTSQQHARLFAKNNSWFVEDLGSTNGTFVNEQKLAAPAMLQPGDKVRVGQTIMELRR